MVAASVRAVAKRASPVFHLARYCAFSRVASFTVGPPVTILFASCSILPFSSAIYLARAYRTLVSASHFVPSQPSQRVKNGCEKLYLMPHDWWCMS